MIAGHPPGMRPPITRSASATLRYAVGSCVPIQSNSSRKRERSVRGELAPWLMTSGRMARAEIHRTGGLEDADIEREAAWVRSLKIQ